MSTTDTRSDLHREFAPQLIQALESRLRPGRTLIPAGRERFVAQPLAALEEEFSPTVLRQALQVTVSKGIAAGVNGQRWFRYTRRMAQFLVARCGQSESRQGG